MKIDIGTVLAFLLAAMMSLLTAWLLFAYVVAMRFWILIPIATTAAAWVGFWGWVNKRWLVAAEGFLLATVYPGVVVSVVALLSFGLFLASLVRALRDRRSRKRRIALARCSRQTRPRDAS